MLHEVAAGDDRHLARPHVRFIDDAAHPAPVIAVRMGIDHGRNRKALTHVLLEQSPRRAHHFRADRRVDDDPAGLAADEGYDGDVEPADLVDARDYLVEPVAVLQLGDTVQ